MFESAALLFMYVETPLHPGSGRGLGPVDLPIQRERTTGYPMVQASTLKGCLRAEARPPRLSENEFEAIFGPETDRAAEHAGALSVGDGRLLLFPLRSLAGVFAWATSIDILARFQRLAELAGLNPGWALPPEPDPGSVWANGSVLTAGDSVVLEEFSFAPLQDHAGIVKNIGQWLASNALPRAGTNRDVYAYWRQALPERLCVLPRDAFRDFACYSTEVHTHVRLNPDKKTVEGSALWTVESLPMDTVLYAPLIAGRSRRRDTDLSAIQVLDRLAGLGLQRTQLGGDETTGQGIVALRLLGQEH